MNSANETLTPARSYTLERTTRERKIKRDLENIFHREWTSNIGITITLNPKKVSHEIDDKQQYRISKLYILKTLETLYKYDHNASYIFTPEITNIGNIHFHGVIDTKDNIQFNRTIGTFRRNLGLVYLSELNAKPSKKNNHNPQTTDMYIKYSLKETNQMIDKQFYPMYHFTYYDDLQSKEIIYSNNPVRIMTNKLKLIPFSNIGKEKEAKHSHKKNLKQNKNNSSLSENPPQNINTLEL